MIGRILAAALLSTLAWPAVAADCQSPDFVQSVIARDHPADVVKFYAGDDARKIAAGIAAMVGEPVEPGSGFLVSYIEGGQAVYVVQFADNCAAHHGRFPAQAVLDWLGRPS